MTISEDGLELIKRFEAFRSEWYTCPAGVWTIGFGTTERVPGVDRKSLPGPIDEAKAEALLDRSLEAIYEPPIEELVTAPLTQSQFDALASFVYNVGPAAFRESTLLEKLNGRRYLEASKEFPRWVHSGGKVLSGLVRRRHAEKLLFLSDSSWASVRGSHIEPRPIEPLPGGPSPIDLTSSLN